MTKTKKEKMAKNPTVSIITPTFNRRPFIPMMIKCFEHQNYPKDKIEWIIIDDGTDKIGDLVSHIPQVKYFSYDIKMTLGRKRNLAHEKSTGDVLVYMDDDDYYPPERIRHAVDTLRLNPNALCAGSSQMNIYFKHVNQMWQFGPYGPNHATAATFAFRRELLKQTQYNNEASLAEEKEFLKDYTIPFVQLNSLKTILVFSHIHNTYDKKQLIEKGPNQFVKISETTVDDFIKDQSIKKFFMEDIDGLLNEYDPGHPNNKPDVLMQTKELKIKRANMEKEYIDKQNEYNSTVQKIMLTNNLIQQLKEENTSLKEKNAYLEAKVKELLLKLIEMKKIEKIEKVETKETNETNENFNKQIGYIKVEPDLTTVSV
jgi:glycosyltransferase involved in cell wall biosynthesis